MLREVEIACSSGSLLWPRACFGTPRWIIGEDNTDFEILLQYRCTGCRCLGSFYEGCWVEGGYGVKWTEGGGGE